jgi:hypothetical protein
MSVLQGKRTYEITDSRRTNRRLTRTCLWSRSGFRRPRRTVADLIVGIPRPQGRDGTRWHECRLGGRRAARGGFLPIDAARYRQGRCRGTQRPAREHPRTHDHDGAVDANDPGRSACGGLAGPCRPRGTSAEEFSKLAPHGNSRLAAPRRGSFSPRRSAFELPGWLPVPTRVKSTCDVTLRRALPLGRSHPLTPAEPS